MISQEIILNEDQKALDEIAAQYDYELDHRKKFHNQVSDLKARIYAVELEAKRKEEEALKDPNNWEFRDGYKILPKFGVQASGIYLVNPANQTNFFVPNDEIANYRVK